MKLKERTMCKKRSISAPAHVFAAADKRWNEKMMATFSEYVRSLIERDLRGEFGGKAA